MKKLCLGIMVVLTMAMMMFSFSPAAEALTGNELLDFSYRAGELSQVNDIQMSIKQDGETRLGAGVCSGALVDLYLGENRVASIGSVCAAATSAVTGNDEDRGLGGSAYISASILGLRAGYGYDLARGETSAFVGLSFVGGFVDSITK